MKNLTLTGYVAFIKPGKIWTKLGTIQTITPMTHNELVATAQSQHPIQRKDFFIGRREVGKLKFKPQYTSA